MSLPYSTHANRGFGLIELLVSMSIMVLVSAVILARHSSFNSAVLLRNQSYEVAFTIREAQNYALSAIFTDSSAGLDSFRDRYGVHFTQGSNVYYLFRDAGGSTGYDPGEEIGAPGRLDSRFVVSAVPGGAGFDVMFERPNFDAIFEPSAGASADIVIQVVGTTNTRTVEVTRTGQISVPGT